jgi:hypothetical protein
VPGQRQQSETEQRRERQRFVRFDYVHPNRLTSLYCSRLLALGQKTLIISDSFSRPSRTSAARSRTMK